MSLLVVLNVSSIKLLSTQCTSNSDSHPFWFCVPMVLSVFIPSFSSKLLILTGLSLFMLICLSLLSRHCLLKFRSVFYFELLLLVYLYMRFAFILLFLPLKISVSWLYILTCFCWSISLLMNWCRSWLIRASSLSLRGSCIVLKMMPSPRSSGDFFNCFVLDLLFETGLRLETVPTDLLLLLHKSTLLLWFFDPDVLLPDPLPVRLPLADKLSTRSMCLCKHCLSLKS